MRKSPKMFLRKKTVKLRIAQTSSITTQKCLPTNIAKTKTISKATKKAIQRTKLHYKIQLENNISSNIYSLLQ